MPSTKNPVPKVREVASEASLSEALIKEAQKELTKLANTGRLYYIRENVRTEINPAVVFSIRGRGDFTYCMYVHDANGYKLLEQEITPSLSYEANFD